MIPPFQTDGNLPPGIHNATWAEVTQRFGGNPQRQRLLTGLRLAIDNLQDAGCRRVYLNGSFVTSKPFPDDFDAVWETEGMDFTRVAPLLLDRRDILNYARRQQKRVYGGELLPDLYLGFDTLAFFQTDDAGQAKGIIAINLGGNSDERNRT